MGFIERLRTKACSDLHEKVRNLERAQKFLNDSINYATQFDRPDIAEELNVLFRMSSEERDSSLRNKDKYSPITRLVEMISRVMVDKVGSIYQITFKKVRRKNEEINMKDVHDARKILQLHYHPRGFYPIPREEVNQSNPQLDLYQLPWEDFAINVGFITYQKTTIMLPFEKSINILPRIKVVLEKVPQESKSQYPDLSHDYRYKY